MTRTILSLATLLGAGGLAAFSSIAGVQDDKELSALECKAMIENMGYTTKDLNKEPGKEKIEFTITKDGLDVPIGIEVSNSKRFVWLTVNVGTTEKIPGFDGKLLKLIQRNAKIQPTSFYVSDKGNLMLGLAVDNRNINATVARHRIEKLASDVAGTRDLWESP